jgi:hypothetical protein
MLPARKNILYCKPPYLLKHPTGKWSLITDVESRGDKIELSALQVNQGQYETQSMTIDDMPFYVGADIWELAYGSVLMTLDHPTLKMHPANQLWSEWRNTGS